MADANKENQPKHLLSGDFADDEVVKSSQPPLGPPPPPKVAPTGPKPIKVTHSKCKGLVAVYAASKQRRAWSGRWSSLASLVIPRTSPRA